jgi:hypothetical protein
VIVTAGVVIGIRASHSNAPAKPSPTVHTTPAPAPSPHAARRVSLAWFGFKPLPGYTLHVRWAEPGYRAIAVRKSDDPDTPYDCNGCENASAYVRVFDRGVFSPNRYGVPGWQRVSVAGTTGYLGSMTFYGERPGHILRTLVWQFRPDRWAMIQAVTDLGGTTQNLLTVARAVEPTRSVPVRLPFTLGYVPALPITGVTDDRSEGYAFTISFGHTSNTSYSARSLDITLWPSGGGDVKHTAANRRSIGGVVGWYAKAVADVPIPSGVVEFGLTHSFATTSADVRDMQRIMQAIHWANGDGSTPWPTAKQAIP